jgi:hypothetical protein
MGFPKVGTQAANKGDIMQVGSLYSCKWIYPLDSKIERGWGMLLYLGIEPVYVDEKGNDLYLFFDVLGCVQFTLDAHILQHCKEITKENSCK